MIKLIGEFIAGLTDSNMYSLMINIVLGMSTFPADSSSQAYKLVEVLYEYMSVIALSFALAFVFIEIIDTSIRAGLQNMTIYQVITPLLKFVLVYAVIICGLDIVSLVLSGSNAFLAYVTEAIEVSTSTFTAWSYSVNGLLPNILLRFLPAFVCSICMVSASIVIGIQVISIKVEMLLRAVFLPLAAANFLSPGGHGGESGWRYIKAFIGNIFTFGSILIMISLTWLVADDAASSIETYIDYENQTIVSSGSIGINIFMSFFKMCLGPFACVGAVSVTRNVVREAFS